MTRRSVGRHNEGNFLMEYQLFIGNTGSTNAHKIRIKKNDIIVSLSTWKDSIRAVPDLEISLHHDNVVDENATTGKCRSLDEKMR